MPARTAAFYGIEELEKGLNAVADPAFTHSGEPEVSAVMRTAAEKISERLGRFRRTTP